MSLPKSWTTVTPLSKKIAMVCFIFFPLIAFFGGIRYGQTLDKPRISEAESQAQAEIQKTVKDFKQKNHDYDYAWNTIDMSAVTSYNGQLAAGPQSGWKTYTDKTLGFAISYPTAKFRYGEGNEGNIAGVLVIRYDNPHELNTEDFVTTLLNEPDSVDAERKVHTYIDDLDWNIVRRKFQFSTYDAEDIIGLPASAITNTNAVFLTSGNYAYKIEFVEYQDHKDVPYLDVARTFHTLEIAPNACIPRPNCLERDQGCPVKQTSNMCPAKAH